MARAPFLNPEAFITWIPGGHDNWPCIFREVCRGAKPPFCDRLTKETCGCTMLALKTSCGCVVAVRQQGVKCANCGEEGNVIGKNGAGFLICEKCARFNTIPLSPI